MARRTIVRSIVALLAAAMAAACTQTASNAPGTECPACYARSAGVCTPLAAGTACSVEDKSGACEVQGSETVCLVEGATDRGLYAKEVTLGLAHTCALKEDGSVWCWGLNKEGQLGDGTKADSNSAKPVVGESGSGTLSGAVSVAAGAMHTCALKGDGAVLCWGLNDKGQLGDGTTTGSAKPVLVQGIPPAAAVIAGGYVSCALSSDADVWCWGLEPTKLPGPDGAGFLADVAQISAGLMHFCAVKKDGTLWCWGDNTYGQLGAETDAFEPTTSPTQVSGIGKVAAVSAGNRHTCALDADGAAWCWGRNTVVLNSPSAASSPSTTAIDGTPGTGDTTSDAVAAPAKVQGISGVKSISSGGDFNLAVTNDGKLWRWGHSLAGPATVAGLTSTPTAVSFMEFDVSAGLRAAQAGRNSHSCVVGTEGKVWCWGWNLYGQLGDGTNETADLISRVIAK